MLLEIIKLRIKIILRSAFADIKKGRISHLLVYAFAAVFLARILVNLFITNQRILRLVSENTEITFVNLQLIIFLFLFISLTIFLVFRSYKYVDPCLIVFPVPGHIFFLFNFLKTFLPALLLDLVYWRFIIRTFSFLNIFVVMTIEILFILFCFDLLYKFLSYRRALIKLIVLLPFLSIVGILMAVWQNIDFSFFHARAIFAIFSNLLISGRLAGVHSIVLRLAISLVSICLIFFMYRKLIHNFNPLMLSVLERNNGPFGSKTNLQTHSSWELDAVRFKVQRSFFISLIRKDARVLIREVGPRLISVSLITSILLLFGLDLIKGGKVVLGTLTTMGIVCYISIILSWVIALPLVGSEKEGLGLMRNIFNLKSIVWSKILFSFIASVSLGLIDFGLLTAITVQKGLFNPLFGLFTFLNILEFSLIFSLSGVFLGTFFANYKNNSGERLKNVFLPGGILYYAAGAFIATIFLLMDILFFVRFIYFILGLVVFNAILAAVALAVGRSAEYHLYRQEL